MPSLIIKLYAGADADGHAHYLNGNWVLPLMRLWVPVAAAIAALFIFGFVTADASFADPDYTYSGNTLTVMNVPDYADSSDSPWAAYIPLMENLVVAEGVDRIGNHAFNGADRLQNVTLPSSLKSIGTEAFRGCTDLTSVEFPSSLESIGICSFSGCTKLAEVRINSVLAAGIGAFDDAGKPGGMTVAYLASTIPASMFRSSSGHSVYIKSITLETVTEISTEAFRGVQMSSVTIPVNLTSIGDRAFMGSSLSSLEIAGTTQLGTGVFSSCTDLTSAKLSQVKSIPESAFEGCTSLSSVTLSDRITYIGNSAFVGTALTDIVFPGTLKTVGANAFASCTSLVHVGFTDSLQYLEDQAFSGCTSLKIVELQNVSNLGTSVFDGCTNIERAYCPITGVLTASRFYDSFTNGPDVLIKYDFGEIEGSCVLFGDTEMKSSYIAGSEGKQFDGWIDASGNRVTDVPSLTESTELTAQWVQAEGADGTLDVVVCALSVICAVIACTVCLRRL